MRLLFVVLGLGLSVPLLTAQESRCADCHFANPSAPGAGHLSEWDHSPHGRNDVGCESCHDGNASTFEPFLAHRGILNDRNPASPIHRVNLAKTCGGCHVGPFVAFQSSKHYELVREGNELPPTCSTCHGDVGAYILSPNRLENKCSQCHGADGPVPRLDFPDDARITLEKIRDVRALLAEAPRLIRTVKDDQRREELEAAYQQAEVPLIEATEAVHRFVFDATNERLGVARERAEALLEALTNPSNPSNP